MKIEEGMLGEYIHLTKEIYPPVCIYYNNRKVLKSEEVSDIIAHAKQLLKQLKIEDKYIQSVENLGDDVLEIIIDENGINRFSLKP